MLLAAITLFVVSTFCYSYVPESGSAALSLRISFPYRGYAVTFVSLGSVLMGVASFSYSKRSKNSL
jgi:hypothetical protein